MNLEVDLTLYLVAWKGYIAQTIKPFDLQMFRYSTNQLYNQLSQPSTPFSYRPRTGQASMALKDQVSGQDKVTQKQCVSEAPPS